jgi:group I intron endonuclease
MIVYITINLINGKKYIGKDVANRRYYLGSGKILKAAIKKYGKENFIKEILAEVDTKEKLSEMETYYIEYYKACDSDLFYNIAQGGLGGGAQGRILSGETKLKMSESAKRNLNPKRTKELVEQMNKNHSTKGKFGKDHHRAFKVYQYDLNNKLIKVWDSMSDIKRILNFNISHISLCINNKKTTAYKFKWFRERI